jgi:hypothetical protein
MRLPELRLGGLQRGHPALRAGLGSPTHALTAASFEAWTVTYQWENLYGIDFLYAGPLFMHQFSHAWIDFRGIRDRFMREKDCDYFENSRRATQCSASTRSATRAASPATARTAGACRPATARASSRRPVAGRRQAFYGYAARGVPWGPDDGTICGPSVLGSLVFAPEIVLPALRRLMASRGRRAATRCAPAASTRPLTGAVTGGRRLDLRRRVRARPGLDRADDRELPLRPAVATGSRSIPCIGPGARARFQGRLALAAPPAARHAIGFDPDSARRDRSGRRERLANVHPDAWRNPPPRRRYHLLVIGAGPRGLVAARKARRRWAPTWR